MTEYRSPRTIAEWQLCKPGDTIQLLGLTVPITEQNYEAFMNEIMWYVNYAIGVESVRWVWPSQNPSSFGNVMTNAYVAIGIYNVLLKYAINRPSLMESLRRMFRGGG